MTLVLDFPDGGLPFLINCGINYLYLVGRHGCSFLEMNNNI